MRQSNKLYAEQCDGLASVYGAKLHGYGGKLRVHAVDNDDVDAATFGVLCTLAAAATSSTVAVPGGAPYLRSDRLPNGAPEVRVLVQMGYGSMW